MKLKVLKEFRDKTDLKTMYKAGQIIEIADNKRAANLVVRELCDFVEDESKQKPKNNTDTNARGKAGSTKKDSVQKPDKDVANDAPKTGSESDKGGEQGSDQE